MPAVLAIVFVVVPIAEIAVLIAVGDVIGLWPTIFLLIAFSVAGAMLAKQQGIAVWRSFRASIARGEVPTADIMDGFLVLFGAALLLTPGFLTDVLGLLLLFPVSRALVKRSLRRGAGWLVLSRFPFLGAVREATQSKNPEAPKVVEANHRSPERPR